MLMTDRTTAQQETLDRAPGRRAGARRVRAVITILHHPDPRRVGERAELTEDRTPLGRLEPRCRPPAGGEARGLADPFVSRRPSHLVRESDGAVRWTRDEHGSGMLADGLPVSASARFSAEQLAQGVVLELAQRVVLLLHAREDVPVPAEPYGLVGESEAIDRVRAAIHQVADLDVPVLLRGESGTGKELVARAIHEASGRAGPLVAVNVAALNATVAASELFGHVRGAFTGAVRDHLGCFREADGGTLFLDEIGDAPPDVQTMLLRTLETREVQAVGGSRSVKVDVRLITATDVDLEAAVAGGAFRSSLVHRLAGFQIPIAPLRERREDIGRLLIEFLREELERVGMADRLEPRDPESPPWLPAEVVARLARYDWPGNVRQLRNVARQIVLTSRGEPHARIDASVELALAPRAVAPVVTEVAPPGAEPSPRRRKPGDVDVEELRAALRACKHKLGPTAERLGISRSSLYDLIDRTPELRRASDIPKDEIVALVAELGDDVDALADRLCVSPRGLRLRMKELGLA